MTPSTNSNRIQLKLSMLWIFVTANYLYCDVLSLMDPKFVRDLIEGGPEGMPMTESFLFYAGLLMEIPLAMILVSRFTDRRFGRGANLVAGLVMTMVQIGSFWFGTSPTTHYMFFSAVEIATTTTIAWIAWNWPNPPDSLPSWSPIPWSPQSIEDGSD